MIEVSSLPMFDELNSKNTNFERSKKLQQVSHQLIPGGAHTYAKGDDQYPELAPGFIVRGEGCHVWDVDGNEYIEYGMGLRAVTLGHGYRRVADAAYRALLNGTNFTRPGLIEVEAAEEFLSIANGADMVKFTKDGSSVTSAALKLARAYTGRDMVGICINHPFFSYDDWFIGTTPMTAGIPKAVRDLSVTFEYNNLASVQALFDQYPGQIACLILEPVKDEDPIDNFLHETMRICHENGALFILDEMITGLRLDLGGGQKYYDIVPDLSTWGKALGNGIAISALAGKREIMELGGINHDRERVFLLSTTHGAETHALAAAIETIHVYKEEPVVEHMARAGTLLANGLNAVIDQAGVQGYVKVVGKPSNLVFATLDQDKKGSQVYRALLMQELIKRGILGPSLVVSYAHSDEDIKHTIAAFGEALSVYHKALEDGAEKYLVGRPVKPVFRKYC
ncbi:MAG TPA: glutamate-1-semialdehyde 2,1-aminomutase [Chloroflexia bacterium]|nr:glutamate-1-semialdehyde 2,1-aminomutase [Chloroflexia bacterium]